MCCVVLQFLLQRPYFNVAELLDFPASRLIPHGISVLMPDFKTSIMLLKSFYWVGCNPHVNIWNELKIQEFFDSAVTLSLHFCMLCQICDGSGLQDHCGLYSQNTVFYFPEIRFICTNNRDLMDVESRTYVTCRLKWASLVNLCSSHPLSSYVQYNRCTCYWHMEIICLWPSVRSNTDFHLITEPVGIHSSGIGNNTTENTVKVTLVNT